MYKDRLIELREEYNLKQYEVANILNIYKGGYNQYETEYLIIPLKHLLKLCKYYKVSLDYIFNFTNIKNYQNNKYNINKELFHKRFKELRKNNKLTQDKLAKILNTTQSTISEYENNLNMISTAFLYTICQKYKISADYLLGKTSSIYKI